MGEIVKLRLGAKGRWVEYYSCPSGSNPDLTYVVAKDRAGEWGCSCPRWKFHRENCKHIQRVNAALAGLAVREVTAQYLSPKTREMLGRAAWLEIDAKALQVEEIEPGVDRAGFVEV